MPPEGTLFIHLLSELYHLWYIKVKIFFMEIIGTVYLLQAAANRLGKSKGALRQAIKRLNQAGLPLEIGPFRFILLGENGYIAIDKDEDLVVIAD